MEFRLLGPLEVSDAGRDVAIGGGRRRALLALLLLHRNEVVPAERLIDELWGGDPPPTAAKGLQVQVSQLRKQLFDGGDANGSALLTRAGGYVLTTEPGSVDVERFEEAVRLAERSRADGHVERAGEQLRAALALWRGPPLVEFAYEPFARDEIARLDELRLLAFEERIDADLELGRHATVIAELEGLVRAHPLRERPRAQLMLSLYRCGRQADALAVFRDGRRASIEELGLEPGRDLRDLHDGILADDPALAAPPRAARPLPRAVRRAPWVLVAAGALVAGAALVAMLRGDGDAPPPRPPAPAIDMAAHAVVGVDPGADGRARYALPLPGRVTDVAAHGDRLYAVTIDSSALTVVDGRKRRLARSMPLTLRPAAVATDGRSVWVADGRRGSLVRFDAGYERVRARATWTRADSREAVGLSRADAVAVAVAAGSAWATDGSRRLVRARADGRVTRVPTPHRLSDVAAGAGAVWAISRRGAAVVRVDPASARVTDVVPIVARPGGDAPAPIAVATTPSAVWVLNGNTATISRIDARTRGVTGTIALPIDRSPRDLAVGAGALWVAGFDGSITRIPERGGRPSSSFVGESLLAVAAGRPHVWVAATALDQQVPGGE